MHQDRLNDYKLAKGCADCGYSLHAAALQFDHVRGTKESNIASVTGGVAWSRIEEELAKCDVVCANCHALRTWERGYYARQNPGGSESLAAFVVETHTVLRGILTDLELTESQQTKAPQLVKEHLYALATAAKAMDDVASVA